MNWNTNKRNTMDHTKISYLDEQRKLIIGSFSVSLNIKDSGTKLMKI